MAGLFSASQASAMFTKAAQEGVWSQDLKQVTGQTSLRLGLTCIKHCKPHVSCIYLLVVHIVSPTWTSCFCHVIGFYWLP